MDVKNAKEPNTIAIVGGGAAGLFAAYFAKLKHPEKRVVLIDKNSYLGAKVLISGGGRCNVTTGIFDVKELLKNYPRGAEFLRTAMENFPPEAVMSWFETQGVALKTESDLRVFPVSNRGQDIVGALTLALEELGVEISLNMEVIDLEKNTDHFTLSFRNTPPLNAEQVILTTGGNAYRHTGSTGDGYSMSKKMGHTINPLAPSLTSLKTAENWSHELSGISFKMAELTLSISSLPPNPRPADKSPTTAVNSTTAPAGARQFKRRGPFLFTHQGVSGPAVFAISSMAAFEKLDPEHPAQLHINLFPTNSPTELLEKLDQIIASNPKKQIENILANLVPHSFAKIIVDHFLKTAPTLQATHLSKVARQQIVVFLQALPLTITGRGVGDEMVTAGGVNLAEVNPKTMESTLSRGLFFAGELLNIDGFTGGFNLQASWATGALAGEST